MNSIYDDEYRDDIEKESEAKKIMKNMSGISGLLRDEVNHEDIDFTALCRARHNKHEKQYEPDHGEALRKLIKISGIKQHELAEELNVSIATITRTLRRPTVEDSNKIKAILREKCEFDLAMDTDLNCVKVASKPDSIKIELESISKKLDEIISLLTRTADS